MGKFSKLLESVPQKRTFTVHAKDETGKDYSYDHESYSPRGVHKSANFEPAKPGGMGGKGHTLVKITHNGKDVTNEGMELNLHESILKAFNEKTEEFKPHQSHFTGHVYHMNKEHAHAVHNLEHGQSAKVEAVHHDGHKLHVKSYTAHKVGNAVHLHDSDDVHVDSFKA